MRYRRFPWHRLAWVSLIPMYFVVHLSVPIGRALRHRKIEFAAA